MKLSVIVPAFNEAKLIQRCVISIRNAIEQIEPAFPAWQFEIVVVDNNSTDSTAPLAREAGARVVFEPVNQIARSRNAGGHAATGDWMLFIDADSVLNPGSLQKVLRAAESGKVAGGGSLITLEGIPFFHGIFVWGWNLISRLGTWVAGSFVFVRADAFRDIGGFGSDLFAAEELSMCAHLKRWARTRRLDVVIFNSPRHVSSGRKFHLYSFSEMVGQFFKIILFRRSTLTNPRRLDYFYDGRR